LTSLVLRFNYIAEEGLVPPRTVFYIPELKLKEVDRQPLPIGQEHKESGKK
jgi:hypothetical protein